MAGLNVFSGSGFSMLELTAAINKLPHTPQQIAKMGLFTSKPSRTTAIAIEVRNNTLALIADSPRGGVGSYNTRDRRDLRDFKALHLQWDDVLTAEELQDVRAFGDLSELQMVQAEINLRLMRGRASVETTVEYGRMGALRGIILDSDGAKVIYNLFNEFGIVQSTVDFVLGTPATEMLTKCTEVRDLQQVALGAVGTDDLEVVAFCGSTWFDRFVTHATVKDAYKYYQERGQMANPMREDLRYKGFTFGGITFIKYRGAVSGVQFQPANEATFFPANVPDLFQTAFAPADYQETVNTPGMPLYAKQAVDPMFQKFVALQVQSNPLSLCTRPEVLVKGT